MLQHSSGILALRVCIQTLRFASALRALWRFLFFISDMTGLSFPPNSTVGPGVHFNGAAPGPLFRSLPTECTRIAIVELLTSSGTLIQHNQVENSLHTEAVSIQAKRCSGCVWAGYGCHSCFDCRSDSSRNSVLSIRSIPSKAILADTQDKCIS